MKTNNKANLIIILFLVLLIFVTISNTVSTQTKDYISPEIRADGIYFRYINPHAENVFLKSSFDEWTYRYAFYKKSESVWELRLPTVDPLYQLEKNDYKYRIIVDGVHIYDNLNPERVKDKFGMPLSILKVPYDLYDYTTSPLKLENDVYRFFIITDRSKSLEIAGSFNNFVPEEMIQDEYRPNIYYKDIILPKGQYYYAIIKDGMWQIDYKNDDMVRDYTGRNLSRFVIK